MQAVISKSQKEQEFDTRISEELDSDLKNLVKPTFKTDLVVENASQINALKEIKKALIRLKLSKNEIKVYLYLARFGAQKAQKIAEALNLHRTEAYKILRTLENEGIIYRVLERPMKFKSITLEKLLNIKLEEKRERIYQLEKKKIELLELWDSLPEVTEPETEGKMLQVTEGKKQIINKISNLLKISEKRFKGVIKDRHLIWIYNSTFFEELESLSSRKNIDAKILTDYSPSSTFVLEQLNLTNCDFAFLHLKDQPSFVISDVGHMILFIENDDDKICVLETNDNSMIKSYENLFGLLWESQNRKNHY
jgi:sugar-specific transcriptional regulator TrmB